MLAYHPPREAFDRRGFSMAARNEEGARWATDSLAHARGHGQARLVGLLEEVRAEIALDAELAEARDLARREELGRARKAERERARLVAWEAFMREERRELGLRQDGQLGRSLGEPLPGEPPEALRRLSSEDRRQAEEGLVALMSGGRVSYKRLEELSEADVPARVAARRLRAAWLKERRDGWLGGGS